MAVSKKDFGYKTTGADYNHEVVGHSRRWKSEADDPTLGIRPVGFYAGDREQKVKEYPNKPGVASYPKKTGR